MGVIAEEVMPVLFDVVRFGWKVGVFEERVINMEMRLEISVNL